jgi:hypothetical protein
MLTIDQSIFYRKNGEPVPANLVLTPSGYRDPSLVHHVAQGHRVRRRKQQLQIVHRSSQRIIDRHSIAQVEVPIPSLGTGWVTFASWENPTGTPISQIDTTWTVPLAPAAGNAGQTIFLFNGLQNSEGSNLLQPVLQWGTSQAGGGGYWGISNWYIDDSGNVCHSDLLPVLPGQVLTGIVALGQQSDGQCTYTIGFDGYPQLDLNVSGVDPSAIAVEVLEAYQIGSSDEYPATPSTSMSSIFIAAGGAAPPITWRLPGQVGYYGEQTTIVSSANPSGELEIIY